MRHDIETAANAAVGAVTGVVSFFLALPANFETFLGGWLAFASLTFGIAAILTGGRCLILILSAAEEADKRGKR